MRVLAIVVFLYSPVSFAAQNGQVFGDWMIGVMSSGMTCAMSNSSEGTLLVKCCADGGCSWALTNSSIGGDKGTQYPALINSDSAGGASVTLLTCIDSSKPTMFLVSDFATMETLSQHGTKIGIALPMASGTFQVIRFSLHGVKEALAYLSKYYPPKNVDTGKGDISL